jgi:hypothetical protein
MTSACEDNYKWFTVAGQVFENERGLSFVDKKLGAAL